MGIGKPDYSHCVIQQAVGIMRHSASGVGANGKLSSPLATKVPQAKSVEALSWAKQSRKEFSVKFETADCVRFPPVEVLMEIRLASQ
jgi:hypothetical protein